MGWTEPNLIKRVDELTQVSENQIKDKQNLLLRSWKAALEKYSRDHSDHFQWKRSGSTTAGVADSVYNFPSQYETEFSLVKSVESPTLQVPRKFLTNKQFEIYPNDYTTYQFIFTESAPNEDVEWAVVFTIRRTLTTVRTGHLEAFANLCASIVCTTVASNLANEQDDTILADTVDNNTTSRTWDTKSKEFLKLYNDVVLPRKREATKGAESVVEVSSRFAGMVNRRIHPD